MDPLPTVSDRFRKKYKKKPLMGIEEAERVYWDHQIVPMYRMVLTMAHLQDCLEDHREMLRQSMQRACALEKQLERAHQENKRLRDGLRDLGAILDEIPADTYVSPTQVKEDISHLLKHLPSLQITNDVAPR